jgi:hypothetical protein
MKKLILASSLFAAMTVMFTSCLKDKGFENGTYGINLDGTPPGIGFPEAAKSINPFAVNAVASAQTVSAPFINILSGQPAQSDVHVTLQVDNTLVTAYNTANGTSLVVPTAAQASFPLTITIPAGSRNATVPIVIPNASTLDLSKTYAVGFRIVSVDGGYTIASNMDRVLISISVKNQYDGIYKYVSGFVQRYLSPGVPNPDNLSGPLGAQNPDIIMFTTGANCVGIPIAGSAGQLTWSPGNSGVAGIDGINICVDPVTNNITSITSSGYATSNATLGLWAGHVNKYDPATKRFYIAMRWNPASTVREYEAVFEYVGPR